MDFQLAEKALGYVFLHCNIDDIASRASKEGPSIVYRVTLPIDVATLLQLSEDLGSMVTDQFDAATRIFQLVCFTTFQTLDLLPSLNTLSQLCVVLRLKDVPETLRVSIHDALQIRRLPMRMVILEGKVCAKSLPMQYTQSAHYLCPESSCAGSEPYRYIRLHCPGAREADTIQKGFSCDYCGRSLVEDVKSRVLSERCHIQLIASDISATGSEGLEQSSVILHRAVSVVLRDELVGAVSLGQNYRITGKPLYEVEEGPSPRAHLVCTIEANNVELAPCNPPLPVSLPINDRLSKLKLACAYSPWAFPATVAYSFAGKICPPGVFHRLKTALLLSLVSIASSAEEGTNEQSTMEEEEEEAAVLRTRRHGLHILSISPDDLMQERLMAYAATCVSTCLRHNQATDDLFGSVKRDTASNSLLISAGSLSLPTRGLCLLGNLGRYRKDVQTSLHHVLEEDTISLTVPGSADSTRKQQVHLPLQCAVWAYADESSKKRNRKPAAGRMYFDKACLSKALVDRFDLVVSSHGGSVVAEDFAESKVCRMLLEQSCTGCVELDHAESLLDEDCISQLIHLAASQKPSFAKGSEDLIRSFFMASRRIRSTGAYGADIPATAINSMTSVAAAHAALCLRSEVTDDDATAAILMFEEAMVACYGSSVLNVTAQPHFRNDNLDAYLGEEHCARMKMFKSQLHQFCSLQGGGNFGWEE